MKNQIYRRIFNHTWIQDNFDRLRPYAPSLNAWVASDYQDNSRLLRGAALQETLQWSKYQRLSELDYRYLTASQTLEQQEALAKVEAERVQAVEARLRLQQRSLGLQRWLLGAVTLATVITSSLGLIARNQYRQAALREGEAVVKTAQALFASQQPFDALLASMRGQTLLARWHQVDPAVEQEAHAILERVVLSIDQLNRLEGHTASVMAVDIHPQGDVLASTGVDTTVRLWKPDGTPLKTLTGHTATVRAIQFSPDGQYLASAGDDGQVRIWTKEGEFLRSLTGEIRAIWDIDFSPDSTTIVVVGATNVVERWNVNGSLIERRILPIPNGATSVAYHPSGERLAFGSFERNLVLWDIQHSTLEVIPAHETIIYGLAFSPDGERLITSSGDPNLKIWTAEGELVKTLEHHTAGIWGVHFSPDGQTFVATSVDKTLSQWTKDGLLLKTFKGHQATVFSLAISPDGNWMASTGGENQVLLWQLENPFYRSLYGVASITLAALYPQDGQTLITSGAESHLFFTDLQQQTIQVKDTNQSIFSTALHPHQPQFLAAGANQTLTIRHLNGEVIQSITTGQAGSILGADWSPDGTEIVAATSAGSVYRWNAKGELLQQWQGHNAPIWDLDYNPQGHQFATAGNDGTLKIWSAQGNLLHTLPYDAAVWRVRYSADGQYVLAGSGDQTAKIWHTETGELVTTFKGHKAAVWGVGFSPVAVNGETIAATSSVDETVKLWRLNGELLATLKGHTAAVRSIAFSPDGQTLASVGEDKVIVLWNLPEILRVNDLEYGCQWIANYLRTNINITENDRQLCRAFHTSVFPLPTVVDRYALGSDF